MGQNDVYSRELESISESLAFISPVENDREINREYVDCYTTRQQKTRDQKITELLSIYVDGYKNKTKSNKRYKAILFWSCIGILIVFCIAFIVFICQNGLTSKSYSIPDVIQLISVCITFLGLIIGLLKIITKYVFPENEEEYITRIVELIQNNDLENKKENIRVLETSSTSE